MTVGELSGEFNSTVHQTSDYSGLSGTVVTLSTLTKTDLEWGSLPGWGCAYANAHNITGLALAQIQALYPGKVINLDGLKVTLTNV
jgi:hypothetical protein